MILQLTALPTGFEVRFTSDESTNADGFTLVWSCPVAPVNCPSGYENDPNDPSRCIDIDECSDATLNICGAQLTVTTCQNMPGSYTCVSPLTYTEFPIQTGQQIQFLPKLMKNWELEFNLKPTATHSRTSSIMRIGTEGADDISNLGSRIPGMGNIFKISKK